MASQVVKNYFEQLNQYQNKKAHSITFSRVDELASTAENVLKNDGKLEVAIELLQKAIKMFDKLMPSDHSLFGKGLKMLNNKAMLLLGQSEDDKALYLLRNAEKMVRKRPDFQGYAAISDMYNNMALAFQRNNFLDYAKDYLEKAQSLNFRHKLPTGVTDMNYGCLLSSMGK